MRSASSGVPPSSARWRATADRRRGRRATPGPRPPAAEDVDRCHGMDLPCGRPPHARRGIPGRVGGIARVLGIKQQPARDAHAPAEQAAPQGGAAPLQHVQRPSGGAAGVTLRRAGREPRRIPPAVSAAVVIGVGVCDRKRERHEQQHGTEPAHAGSAKADVRLLQVKRGGRPAGRRSRPGSYPKAPGGRRPTGIACPGGGQQDAIRITAALVRSTHADSLPDPAPRGPRALLPQTFAR